MSDADREHKLQRIIAELQGLVGSEPCNSSLPVRPPADLDSSATVGVARCQCMCGKFGSSSHPCGGGGGGGGGVTQNFTTEQ